MATVSHTIYSRYDPQTREQLEEETPQSNEDELANDPWQTESSFPPHRLADTAPHFVPAKHVFDDWGLNIHKQASNPSVDDGSGAASAAWYRTLTSTTAKATSTRTVSEAGPSKSTASKPEPPTKKLELRTKNNWFIQRAIQSEPSSAPSTPPPSTLADILARDPPPLPAETPYTPPVWLALGPSNKGWAMLQRSGWNEGEGLGSHIHRPPRPDPTSFTVKKPSKKSRAKSEEPRVTVKREDKEIKWEDDIHEIRKNVDVIDLTVSDSEEEPPDSGDDEVISDDEPHQVDSKPLNQPVLAYSQKSLLTPIAVVLKSDRLGLGLKAKTVGPYRASQKRVTHNAAAMALHIRAAEDARRRKAEVGRGRRGFARMEQRERKERQEMLAYLNQ